MITASQQLGLPTITETFQKIPQEKAIQIREKNINIMMENVCKPYNNP